MFPLGRFGAQALKWKNFQTMQEYLSHGMTQSVAYYVVSFCVLIFWNKVSPRDLAFVSLLSILVVLALKVGFSGTTSFSHGHLHKSYIFFWVLQSHSLLLAYSLHGSSQTPPPHRKPDFLQYCGQTVLPTNTSPFLSRSRSSYPPPSTKSYQTCSPLPSKR